MIRITAIFSILLIVIGLCWAYNGDYSQNYTPAPANYNTDYTASAPQVSTGTIPVAVIPWNFTNQTAMNTYNNANAFRNSVQQAMPVIDYSNTNLPSQATYPSIDYQKMRVNAMRQAADYQNYTMQQMKKNDDMMRQYTWEDDTAPAFVEPDPGQYKYNPAYTPSFKEK